MPTDGARRARDSQPSNPRLAVGESAGPQDAYALAERAAIQAVEREEEAEWRAKNTSRPVEVTTAIARLAP